MGYEAGANIRLVRQPEIHLLELVTICPGECYVVCLTNVATPLPIKHQALRGQNLIQIAPTSRPGRTLGRTLSTPEQSGE